MGVHVEVDDFAEEDARVLLPGEHVADRGSDLAGRKGAGCDLIEQRLKEVVVAPVDDRDFDRCVLQMPARR